MNDNVTLKNAWDQSVNYIKNFVNLYHKYKVQELEIRNNLKLGVPSQNEFHIKGEVSIFKVSFLMSNG